MTIRQIVESLSLRTLCAKNNLDLEIQGGYASDMLSCVMAGARQGNLWVTLLTHLNVIAVAVLLEIPAIIITENAPLESAVLTKAEEEGIVVLQTPENTYTVVGKLYTLGVR
jgi:serine kinase of HPr protein (carbohydrate metabolism regulator)